MSSLPSDSSLLPPALSSHESRISENVDSNEFSAAAATLFLENETTNKDEEHEDGIGDSTLDEAQDHSLVIDLHAHLNDENLSDVSLVGTDGKSVVAVRSILAMRSRFFKRLFFGQFRERHMTQVPLGYSSLVLKAVVEYCYTDEIKTSFETLSFEETARSMVGLVTAGNFFELQGLYTRAYRLTCLMMDEYPALACAVLDEASGLQASELVRVALGIIRLRTESALLPPDMYGLGVQSLGATALERILTDDEIQASELTLFTCLQKWVLQQQEDRVQVARQLATHIDFSKILPSDLCTTVADSGLVPSELMLVAYRTQALQAERKGMSIYQMRSQSSTCGKPSGRIMVQGAGLAAVNGTYVSCDCDNSYSRQGALSGYGVGEFVLHTSILQDESKKWFLSFCCADRTMLDLYAAPVLSELDPPPMQKWLPVTHGHERLAVVQNRRGQLSRKKRHTSFDSSQHDDGGGVGDPPPICIWLPNDSHGSASSNNA